jgi:Domain of unknown function (DUF4166)
LSLSKKGLLVERIGLIEIVFSLVPDGGGVAFRQLAGRLRILGLCIPLPRFLAPFVVASERPATDGRSAIVEVTLRVPMAGMLASYRGEVTVTPA